MTCPFCNGTGEALARQSLTAAQMRVYRAIVALYEAQGYSPSFQQVADAVGLRSLASVSEIVQKLKAKGWVHQQRLATKKKSENNSLIPFHRDEKDTPMA